MLMVSLLLGLLPIFCCLQNKRWKGRERKRDNAYLISWGKHSNNKRLSRKMQQPNALITHTRCCCNLRHLPRAGAEAEAAAVAARSRSHLMRHSMHSQPCACQHPERHLSPVPRERAIKPQSSNILRSPSSAAVAGAVPPVPPLALPLLLLLFLLLFPGDFNLEIDLVVN